jgi:hypothetical protein
MTSIPKPRYKVVAAFFLLEAGNTVFGARTVLVNIVFGIATLASLITLFRKLKKDRDWILFSLGIVALIAAGGCYVIKSIDSRSFSVALAEANERTEKARAETLRLEALAATRMPKPEQFKQISEIIEGRTDLPLLIILPVNDPEAQDFGLWVEAYASVSGSAITGGTASEYGVEQISNISRFGRLP